MYNKCTLYSVPISPTDVKKMPLGKLSKGQIAKGFDVLDDIEKELNANRYTSVGLTDVWWCSITPLGIQVFECMIKN